MKEKTVLYISLIISLVSCSDPSDQQKKKNELILSADREAQIGWVNFDAYADSTFEYSLSPRHKYRGTYRVNSDTLFLTCADTTIGIDTAIIRTSHLNFMAGKVRILPASK